jgi:methylamine---glutamate N-methyltransferase subunit A
MCGIVGYLDKTDGGLGALGETILGMLQALECRGPDSAGVALFSPPQEHRLTVRVKLGDVGDFGPKVEKLAKLAESFEATGFSKTGSYACFLTGDQTDVKQAIERIEALDTDFEVVSMGRALDIVKQVGSPGNLEATYGISRRRGSHGLGHTRLSTESRIDLSHSQPFWGHGYPDLAIVHNGHITNYHQLRRRYEQRAIKFYTENDSEIIAIYLAEQLGRGCGLEASLQSMLSEFDGSYSCLAATTGQLGFVKDPYALKPLLVAETDRFVALANEEVAIRAQFRGAYQVREANVKEVRVWQR